VYHLQWCTKYRFKYLKRERINNSCERILRDVAERWGIGVLELNVQAEHVHALVELKPCMSVSRALMLLKGATSRLLFKQFERFRLRYPKGHFWSAGNFARSISDVSIDIARDYVRNQRSVHQTLITSWTPYVISAQLINK